MIKEVNIPEDRKGVLIGRGGAVKADLETQTKTRITVGDGVTIEGDDPIMLVKAAEAVKAVGRGFSPRKAMLLLREGYMLRVISLREESDNTIKRLMARVIGRRGAARRVLERETNCLVSVYGRTVSLIGTMEDIPAAERAIEGLLKGRSHGYVYARLKKR